MYDQILDDPIFMMLYAVVAAMAAVASIYLLFRRGNAFAAEVTPPLRLRRWTAAFMAASAIGHLWYMPIVVSDSGETVMLTMLFGALLDCLLTIPLALIVMLCMLQDRRRPLWLVGVMVSPLVLGMVVFIVTRSEVLLPWLYGYFLLAFIGFTIYMVRAVRQYGRWLRDNYADLENKEVWQSFMVLALMIPLFGYYVIGEGGMAYEYIVQLFGLVLIGYLLWRVETLRDLTSDFSLTPSSSPRDEGSFVGEGSDFLVGEGTTAIDGEGLSSGDDAVEASTPLVFKKGTWGEADALQSVRDHSSLGVLHAKTIGALLQQHCEEPQLYLQYDLSISQLATLIGTNRSYLSKHFSLQGVTYNAYINGLRIQHFVNLCHERADAHRSISVQQLSLESGFRSYSTFNAAFKQFMGMTATEWIRNVVE